MQVRGPVSSGAISDEDRIVVFSFGGGGGCGHPDGFPGGVCSLDAEVLVHPADERPCSQHRRVSTNGPDCVARISIVDDDDNLFIQQEGLLQILDRREKASLAAITPGRAQVIRLSRALPKQHLPAVPLTLRGRKNGDPVAVLLEPSVDVGACSPPLIPVVTWIPSSFGGHHVRDRDRATGDEQPIQSLDTSQQGKRGVVQNQETWPADITTGGFIDHGGGYRTCCAPHAIRLRPRLHWFPTERHPPSSLRRSRNV